MIESSTFDEHFISLLDVLKNPDINPDVIKEKVNLINLRDKKMPVDSALRESILSSLKIKDFDKVKSLVSTCAAIAITDLCSSSMPFLLFADIFNTCPLDVCEMFFPFMEITILNLKELSLFAAGRNTLLRMCNDLLKRLSKSQNTAFCGRIQLFLTKLFPIDEKSGLNIMSNFNSEKDITYSENPDEDFLEKHSMSVEFYRKFWSLQSFFKNPTLCYDAKNWRSFQQAIDEVLNIFSSVKIFHFNEEKNIISKAHSSMYLTSEMLIHLQLMDMNFRRNILIQILIIFHYLVANVKFKTQDQILSDEQKKWIFTKKSQVNTQLDCNLKDKREKTGEESFLGAVNHILSRESHWNEWKNSGCPSFIGKNEVEPSKILRKRKINPLVDRSGRKIFRFGNASLDALPWTTTDHHLDFYRTNNRVFEMTLEDYFADAILELKPEEKVEEEYKKINKEEWTWRSLRFMSKKNACSLASQKPGMTVKEFFIFMLTKVIGKELQNDSDEAIKEVKELPSDASAEKPKAKLARNEKTKKSSSNKSKSKEVKKHAVSITNRNQCMDDISSADEESASDVKPSKSSRPKSKIEISPSIDDTDGEAEDISEDDEE